LIAVLRFKLAMAAGTIPSVGDRVAAVRSYFRYMNRDDQDAVERVLTRSPNVLSAIDSGALAQVLPKVQDSRLKPALEEFLRANGLRQELDVLRRHFRGFQAMVGSLEDAVDQKVPLAEISEVAATFRDDTAAFVETLHSALERARITGAGRDELGVALATYFKAKGLQWHSVILATCNDGLIPHRKAPVEDERRLFYVAMTRASSNLLISYVDNAISTKVVPSRFLSEAGLLP
jgi:DNA helicase-2/ATP-dependent DNA helicase PcrA